MKKIFKDEELPLYELFINDEDETGTRRISIVEDPAIEIKGFAFNKNEGNNLEYFKANKEKQIIVGPAAIPNMKIKRKDPKTGDFYMIYYKKETVEKMVQKFNSSGTNRKINFEHTNIMVDAFITESWIVEDPYYDKSKLYGFDVPVGTWMIMVKINDKEFWKNEVRGNYKTSFSIEGLYGERPETFSLVDLTIDDYINELTEDEIIEIFQSVNDEIVIEYMKMIGKDKKGLTFADDDELTLDDLEQPEMFYQYVGPDDEQTRPFCKKMLDMDKYWSEKDLEAMTDYLGYDFKEYFGSFNCRHKLQRVFISGKVKEPTENQIADTAALQPDLSKYF